MNKLLVLAAAMALGMTAPSPAAESGWALDFSYDAFADKTVPMAMMSESVEGFQADKANLFIACANDGIAVLFQPERMSMDKMLIGKFRGATGVEDFTFSPVDIPIFGRAKAIIGEDTDRFLAIFSAATAPVPFQAGAKSGKFSVIGFKDVRAIIESYCLPPTTDATVSKQSGDDGLDHSLANEIGAIINGKN